ncbi:MAG: glycoside hydrolase family 78 protein [Bacteroidales bacterium]|nr:glycoside hydrolase family 78 protein [Bacteroidales bacterium]
MRTTLFSLVCSLLAMTAAAQTRVTDLRVQNAHEPLAVEDRHPVFSWKMASDVRGAHQESYRIRVVRECDGSTVWDSGEVQDGRSDNVRYAGVALQADMGYRWELSVRDGEGAVLTAESRFETGLMNPRMSAWKGADWVGGPSLKLDAASQAVYGIRTDFRIVRGSSAALVFGADDFRLRHAFMNGYAVASEQSYFKVEVEPARREIRIWRVGYFPGDRADRPLLVLNPETCPEGNLDSVFAASEQHRLELEVEASQLSLTIDGTPVVTAPARRRGADPLIVGMTGRATRASRIPVSVIGSGGNFPSFPNLCSVGFAAEAGTEVEFTDYQLLNAGQSEDRVVFGPEHYGIFEGLSGIRTEGSRIRVSGQTLAWADPSHGAETMLRSEFTPSGKVRSARLYAAAMGTFRLYLNGTQVGADWFAPGDSQYRETMCYLKYDVTSLLREGRNALGAELAGGWYTGYVTFSPGNFNFFGDREALLARLVVTYEDGRRESFVTEPSGWKVWQDGPVRLGSFFQGERYDARKRLEGWSGPGFDDSAWASAVRVEPRPWMDFDIVARKDDPVRVRETLTARRIMPVHDDCTYIYDMGVNMVGVPEIDIPAGWLQAGDVVTLTYGEQVYPGLRGDRKEYVQRFGRRGRNVAGHILYETNRAALDADFYIADGSGAVTIRPRDTFRGYQYIQVHIPSHAGALPVENVRGLVLSSCEVPTGTYHATTADGKTGERVDQLFRNIQRSQLGNFLTLPTDCPQRNECMGWTGDAQAYVRTGLYQADTRNFFRQWMVALRADQGVGDDRNVPGGIGSTVPTYNRSDDSSFADGTTWGAAVCQVPWQIYNQYGDTQIIEENLETMMDWLNGMAFYRLSDEYPYLSSKASGLADHLALDNRTPPDLLNNAIYIHMMEVTAVMAEAVGRTDYAALLRDRHDRAKADWNRAYVDPATGKTRGLRGRTIHTQASYATPLNFNVFSEENRPKAQQYLSALAAAPATSGPTPEEAEAQKDIQENVTSAFGVLGSGNTDFNFKPYTITTGFSGTPNILPALSRAGDAEGAFRMISCTDNASWLYPVVCGATSVWERWNSYDAAFSEPNQNSMNSFNHFALGAVGQWMFEYQLGITADYAAGGAGYKHFLLQPTAGGDFTALEGSYDSHYGRIESAWTAEKGNISSYRCRVPANTSATLYLPVGSAELRSLGETAGARCLGACIHLGRPAVRYELTAGVWNFTVSADGVSVR